MSADDTIFAVASGQGRAAIAVLRISGPATSTILTALAGRLPAPREARLRRLRDNAGETLDQAMVLWLPGPHNFTGEDSGELHLHAGPAVLDSVSGALVAHGGRPAEPGEFSRRAFLNGRMELTEAEAVADLIEAETAAQRRQALRQLDGGLSRLFDNWAARLKALLAEQEALIDFPEDIGEAEPDAVPVYSLIQEISAQMADDHRGERLRSGLHFVVTGPPNAGKSSLVNALAGRDAAIVSPTAGTTRDVIEVRTIFGGVPVTLLDTAGLRDSEDPVEAEGVRRARASAADADLVLSIHEAGTNPPTTGLVITTKSDLAPAPVGTIAVSTLTQDGLPALRSILDDHAKRLTSRAGPPPLTRARHRAACQDAVGYLQEAIETPMPELRAEALRLAMRALGRVTGRVGVEQILDLVFSQFCIGK